MGEAVKPVDIHISNKKYEGARSRPTLCGKRKHPSEVAPDEHRDRATCRACRREALLPRLHEPGCVEKSEHDGPCTLYY